MRLTCRFCRRAVITILAVLSVFVACERAQAQSNQTGRLTGRITDTSGAPLAGITLVITGEALSEPRTVVTDDAGRFEVATLPAGRVSVTCNAPGFVQWRRDGVDLRPGAPVTLNFTMRREGETGAAPPPPMPVPIGRGNRGAPPAVDPPPQTTVDEPPAVEPGVTPAPAPAPPPVDPQLTANERFVQGLNKASIAFNAPESMLVGATTDIHLLLSPTLSVEALQDKLQGRPGSVEGAVITITPRMEAVLTGESFEITPVTPALQAVTLRDPTEWRWRVTAKSAGPQRLDLVLNIIVDGTARTHKVFEHRMQVDVTWGQQLSGFARANWQWLWTTALVPLAGWLWRRHKVSRQAPEHSETGR